MTTTMPPSQRLRAWLVAIRPPTLLLSASPVLLAAAIFRGTSLYPINWPVLLITLLSAMAIQAGTNLLNDAEDHLRGNDGPSRKGPPRASANGLLGAEEVRNGAINAFMLAAAGGVLLVLRGGAPIFMIGLMSIAAGWAYSAGPRPLSHTPLGELLVFVFFGVLAVSGSFYLLAGHISPPPIFAGMSMGAFAAAVLHVNNVRDMAEDRRAGRVTLAILIDDLSGGSKDGGGNGEDKMATRRRMENMGAVYAALVLAPFVFSMAEPLLFPRLSPRPLGWLPLLGMPLALLAVYNFMHARGHEFNRLLVMTISLQALYALLLGLAFLF